MVAALELGLMNSRMGAAYCLLISVPARRSGAARSSLPTNSIRVLERLQVHVGVLTVDSAKTSAGVVTKPSGTSVPETIERLKSLMEHRGFTVFNVIDHRAVAERAGVQIPDSKLVMFGKPSVGAAVMLAAPLAALDIPLKVLVWEDENGAVSVSYNSPEFLGQRYHLEGGLRAPFDAVESIVEAALGA